MLRKIYNRLHLNRIMKTLDQYFPLKPTLDLPIGVTEKQLFDFVTTIRVSNAPEAEMKAYGTHDFRRFVYTYGLTHGIKGKCLELGANPYFTTMLLKKFTDLELELANYFGTTPNGPANQDVTWVDIGNTETSSCSLSYQHFNIEEDTFPYDDEMFDVVIFAEIIEHLLNDPCRVLREIHRVLKPGGTIILTTPNVSRLENVARMIAGENIYDPYSGYGPYGRHNREYNRHELIQLLNYEGFKEENHFTADVHSNNSPAYCSIKKLKKLVSFRENDLGQYIFIRARKEKASPTKRPRWLFRSYDDSELS